MSRGDQSLLYDDHLRKHLRSICPPETYKVCLYGDIDGEDSKRYPAEGHFLLWEDQEIPVPDGLYLVGFYNKPGRPLKTDGPKYIRVQRSGERREAGPEQATLLPGNAAVAPRPPELLPEHQSQLSEIELDLRRATAEFSKHRMAVAMQRDAVGLARTSRQAQELAEQAALNRTYRTEMEAMAQTHSNLTSRHVEHSARLIDAFGATAQMLSTVISNLQKAAEKIGQPAPAPIDYSDTILKGLGMAGGLALQLIATAKGQTPVPTPPQDPHDDSVEAVVSEPIPIKQKAPPPKKAPESHPQQKVGEIRQRAKQRSSNERTAPQAAEPRRDTRAIRDEARPPAKSANSKEEGKESTALPVEDSNRNSALDYFLDPSNEPQLDDFLGQLQKFGTRKDLEQFLALRMPHLLKRVR